MTSRSHERSSRYYEREAEATRHRLAHDLDELGDRLTPGQVFDEMLTYAKGGGGTFLRTLSNATRENPVPSLLIGAGCMMFLSEKMGLNRYIMRKSDGDDRFAGSVAYDTSGDLSRDDGMISRAANTAASTARSAAGAMRSGVRSASEQASDVAEGVKKRAAAVGDTISSATQRVKETASSATQRVRDTAENLRDQASETGEQIKRGAQDVTESLQEYSARMAETADRTRRQTMRAAEQAKDTLVSFVNEQPLLCAAIGLAVGAAIAAALPSTETEDELMGEASDAVKEAVSETASDQFATAKAAATRVAQEAKSAAEREGLTPAAAVEAAKNLGEKVKTVVSEAGAAGKSEVREFASTSTSNKT